MMTKQRTHPPGTMEIPYLDLSIKDPALKAELMEAVERVLDHGRFILGPEHQQFEEEVAGYCHRRFAAGVGSGTDALYLSLRALDMGPGDEVITTPLTWVATVNAIQLCGVTPVFADIGEDLNMDADKIEAAITPRTKVILPVHFTGQMCDMDAILKLAEKRGLTVIEDAAQAFGARDHGRPAGSFGLMGCFSMNPMKVLNGLGEAGAIVTDDEAIVERLRSLRYAGTVDREDCHWPSINGRLDTLQAAVLRVNLKHLDAKIEARRKVAEAYRQALDGVVECAKEKDGFRHSYYCFTIFTGRRQALREFLAAKGVETKIQHPLLMTQHTAYRGKFKADIPVAERLVERILCLPAHEDMTPGGIDYVASSILEFLGN